MRKILFMGLVALALCACKNPGGSELDLYEPAETYTGTKSGITYTLTISGNVRNAVGDAYTFTAKGSNTERTSTGKVAGITGSDPVSGFVYTLQPSNQGAPSFSVNTIETRIVFINNVITYSDGYTEQGPGSISTSSSGGGGSSSGGGGGGGGGTGGGGSGPNLAASVIEFAQASITKTYGEHKFTITVQPGYEGTGAVTYSSGSPGVASVDASTGEVTIHKAGSAVISAVKAACTTHQQAQAQYNLTVNKATLTVSADIAINVNEPVPDFAAEYSITGFEYGDTKTAVSGVPGFSCSYSLGDRRGSYPINISLNTLSAENYGFNLVDGLLSVGLAAQAPLSIVGSDIGKTWGDADFTLSTGATGSGGGPVRYVKVSDPDNVISISGDTVNILRAGSAQVKAQKRGDSEYNHTESPPITITVGKRDISNATVTIGGTHIFTGSAQEPAIVTDIIPPGGNKITASDYTVSYSNNINPGTATVTITAAAGGNYTGSPITGTFTIVPAPITSVVITGITAPVTAATPSSTASVTGNFTITTVSWSPSHNPFAASTAYTVSVALAANANYTFSGGLSTATINGNTAAITSNTGTAATLEYQFPTTAAPISLSIGSPYSLTYTSPATYAASTQYLTPVDPVIFKVDVIGFANESDSEYIGLTITDIPGLSFSGHSADAESNSFTGNTKTFTVTVSFDGSSSYATTPVTGPKTINVTLDNLPVSHIYTGSGVFQIVANIKDGLNPADPIRVDRGNIRNFNIFLSDSNTSPTRRNRHYVLTESIAKADLRDDLTSPNNWVAIQNFSGIFDGDNNSITGLTISVTSTNQGMFGSIYSNGEVRNTNLVDVDIRGSGSTGGIAGEIGSFSSRGLVENCTVSGEVRGGNYYAGGVVGRNWGSVRYSSSSCIVSGSLHVGGIAGYNGSHQEGLANAAIVEYCYSTGSVTSTGTLGTGGVVGKNYYGAIVQFCYATGNVTGIESVGGVVGENDSSDSLPTTYAAVEFSYATGDVSGSSCVGGVVGINRSYSNTSIYGCYSTGVVSGSYAVGGIAGMNYQRITNCFALNDTVTTSGSNTYVGPYVGRIAGDSYGGVASISGGRAWEGMKLFNNTDELTVSPTGLTTKNGQDLSAADIKTQATWPAPYDFVTTWVWDSTGVNMPSLLGVGTAQPWPGYLQ